MFTYPQHFYPWLGHPSDSWHETASAAVSAAQLWLSALLDWAQTHPVMAVASHPALLLHSLLH